MHDNARPHMERVLNKYLNDAGRGKFDGPNEVWILKWRNTFGMKAGSIVVRSHLIESFEVINYL